jgi:hypothetical protein
MFSDSATGATENNCIFALTLDFQRGLAYQRPPYANNQHADTRLASKFELTSTKRDEQYK